MVLQECTEGKTEGGRGTLNPYVAGLFGRGDGEWIMGDMYEKLRAKIAMMKNEIYRTKEGRGVERGARQDTPLGQLAGEEWRI